LSQALLTERAESIRFGDVRLAYHLGQITLSEVDQLWREWVASDECLIFEGKDEAGENHMFARPMAKRGNPAYRERVGRRFLGIEDLFESDVLISPKEGLTNCLFATFTLDRQLCDVETGWLSVGEMWDRFVNAFRRRYGRLDFCRVWQCHADRYPHVHAIIVTHGRTFQTFIHKGTVRIQEKDQVASLWEGGFVDIEVPTSTGEVASHFFRYVSRFAVGEPTSTGSTDWDRFNDSLAANASLMSLFRKQSFGISRGWSGRLKALQQGRSRLDKAPCTIPTAPLSGIRLVGFGSLGQCIRVAKGPVDRGTARVTGFELGGLPLDFRDHFKLQPTSEHQGALIASGSEITDPNQLDRYLYGPVYDELTVKERRRLERGFPTWRGRPFFPPSVFAFVKHSFTDNAREGGPEAPEGPDGPSEFPTSRPESDEKGDSQC